MRYFIAEDDMNIIKILERIITERNLGEVVGFAQNGETAKQKILKLQPDIVLMDLFIPGIDGITLVGEILPSLLETVFVMISQVSSKDMIGKAYESGVKYYIQKPVNAIEVENVLNRVSENISNTRKLSQIKNLFSANQKTVSPGKTLPDNSRNIPSQYYRKPPNNRFNEIALDYDAKIKRVLQKIGVIGESGTQDIIDIIKLLVLGEINFSDYTIKELLNQYNGGSKTLEQRIRRTAMRGMINLAHMGIEDNMNETFLEYSNGLYNFTEVKHEMDCIREKTRHHGRVNIRKFIDGLVLYCEK